MFKNFKTITIQDGYFPENIENIIYDFEQWCESVISRTIDKLKIENINNFSMY